MIPKAPLVMWFEKLGRGDVALVGGKNASLGEMLRNLGKRGVRVPPGFATTAHAYWRFVDANGLRGVIADSLAALEAGHAPLAEVGATIRRGFLRGTWPQDIAAAIRASYRELCRRTGKADADVAVRSSATAEDLPDASFAGQQEWYLNIRGEPALLDACRRCYASLFTDRAISYRRAKGFDHLKIALSVGVQTMVRSDLGGAGVMFSIDPRPASTRSCSSMRPGGSEKTSCRARSILTNMRCSSRSCRSLCWCPSSRNASNSWNFSKRRLLTHFNISSRSSSAVGPW